MVDYVCVDLCSGARALVPDDTLGGDRQRCNVVLFLPLAGHCNGVYRQLHVLLFSFQKVKSQSCNGSSRTTCLEASSI